MELSQLEQMVRKLDEERKCDKAVIMALQERIEQQVNAIESQSAEIERLQRDIAELQDKGNNAACLGEKSILERLLITRDLVIHPVIDFEKQLGPASIDVRLGTLFLSERTTSLTQIDSLASSDQIEREMLKTVEKYVIDPTDAYVLHPNDFALACTFEYVKIPLDLVAELGGRSSWARKGLLIHATASGIAPGFEGLITFELSNISTLPIELYPMLRIGQLTFYNLDRETALGYGSKKLSKYQGDLEPAWTRLHKDPEWWIIKKQRELDQLGASRRSSRRTIAL